MNSIFMDKESMPATKELKKALGDTFATWQELQDFTRKSYPAATEAWNFSGAKHGWSFRISDKKRVLLYLLPRDKFFKVALVFGQKATDAVMKSNIAEKIKTELQHAKVYGEGRGIRIDITDHSMVNDIKELIKIKIAV